MTCIVGLARAGVVYIGADSAGVNDMDRRVRADKKVFKNGKLIFGFTTSFRMGQILEYDFSPPPIHEEQQPYAYAVKTLVPAIREAFRRGGFLKIDNNREIGGTFMIGFRGHLFVVYDDFQVSHSSESFEAIGSGHAYAMGAMYASPGLEPNEILEVGLRAAVAYNTGVCAPFHFVELGGELDAS